MNKTRIFFDRITNFWMIIAMLIILSLPVIILVALFLKSTPILYSENIIDLLFSSKWSPLDGKFGFFSFITSSVYVTVLSFLLAAPVCILAGIYLTQFASKRLVQIMHPVIDILAGLPSVIYGVWGVLIIVPFVGKVLAPMLGFESSGYTILSGGIVLSIMCIPYMLNMLIEVFNSIPKGMIEASLSLGANNWEAVKHVVIRHGFAGIVSSYGLGLAKAFGETLAVMMVVGNMIKQTFNPFESGYPLPALIANNYGEMLSIPMYDSALMLAALILLVVILLLNIVFRFLIYKSKVL